ncbi:MAG: thiol-disulfide oxidoreductase DCC family protein [Saprospiraceae bacterium]|nr:thiol-disulfide oxidoreductase DCC family protein [Saprospiraceae bacterium]
MHLSVPRGSRAKSRACFNNSHTLLSVHPEIPPAPILLFDGVCNLCNASVQWVLQRDRAAVFRFAALQSEAGQALLARFGLETAHFDTVVLVDGDRIFTRSDAALEILRRLGMPWSALAILRWVPRRLRDAVYNWVARNRYRWFGRQEQCLLPRKEWAQRFL